MFDQLRAYSPRSLVVLLVMCLAVAAAAELSRQLSAGVSDMSAVWPPIGMAVGAALVIGRAVFPAYGITLVLWFLYADYSLELALAVAFQEALMAAITTYFLERGLKAVHLLSSLGDTIRFYLLGCVLVLLPLSILVTYVVRQLGFFTDFFFADVMLVYWLAESLGVMLFAPLAQQMSYAFVHRRRAPSLSRRAGLFLLALSTLMICNYLLMDSGQYLYGKVLTYFYFPLLAWVAISGERWLAPASVALVGLLVPGFVVAASSTLEAPGFALLEAVIVVFVVTVMTQLVHAVSGERHSLMRRFEDQSQQDLLTGLKNDRGLLNDVSRSRQQADGLIERMAVVELINFGEAHDLLEEHFCIRLEKYVAEEIRQSFHAPLAVARIAEGQFALYWQGSNEAHFKRGIDGLLERLNGEVYVEPGAVYRLFIAVGIIEMVRADAPPVALAAARQMAGHAAGARDYPVSQCRLSDPRVQQRQARLSMLEELKEALSHNRLVLFAQEIRRAEGRQRGVSFEVLVRLKRADGTIVSPAEFLPVAEDYGLMADVDRWVVKAVHEWALRFPQLIPQVEKCAINLSGMTLADPGFHEWLREVRRESPLPAANLCFEVTETQMIADWGQAFDLLSALRADGHPISLDDFGTGLATFEYLTRFPFDFVKIDGRFIREVKADVVDQSIVRAVTDVAATMRLQTIAEFVGDVETRLKVASLGVDYVQGFGISRPMPLSELMLLLGEPQPSF